MNQDEARLLSRALTGAIGRLDGSHPVAPDPYGAKATASTAAREYPPEEKERVASGLRSIPCQGQLRQER